MANNSRIHGNNVGTYSHKNPRDQSINPFYPDGEVGNSHSDKDSHTYSANPLYPAGDGDNYTYEIPNPGPAKPYPRCYFQADINAYGNTANNDVPLTEHGNGRDKSSGTNDNSYHRGYKDGFTDRDSLSNTMADYRDPDVKAPKVGLASELHDIQFDFYYKGRLWSIRGALSDTGTLNIRPEQDGRLIIELAGMDE